MSTWRSSSRPSAAELEAAIRRHDGVLRRVAAEFGCSRPTLYRWIWSLGLQHVAGLSSGHVTDAAVPVELHGSAALHASGNVNPGGAGAPMLVGMEAQSDAAVVDLSARVSADIKREMELECVRRKHAARRSRYSLGDLVADLWRERKQRSEQ